LAIMTHTCTYNAHSKNGVVSDLGVTIMRKLAENIENLQTRIGSWHECQGKWNSTLDNRLSIT